MNTCYWLGTFFLFLFRIRGMNHQQGYPKPAEAKQEAISNGLKQPMKISATGHNPFMESRWSKPMKKGYTVAYELVGPLDIVQQSNMNCWINRVIGLFKKNTPPILHPKTSYVFWGNFHPKRARFGSLWKIVEKSILVIFWAVHGCADCDEHSWPFSRS